MKLRKRILSLLLAAVLMVPQTAVAAEIVNDGLDTVAATAETAVGAENTAAGIPDGDAVPDTGAATAETAVGAENTAAGIPNEDAVPDTGAATAETAAGAGNTAAGTPDAGAGQLEVPDAGGAIANAAPEGGIDEAVPVDELTDEAPGGASGETAIGGAVQAAQGVLDKKEDDLSLSDISEAETASEDEAEAAEEEVIGAAGPADDAKLPTGVYYLATNKYHKMLLGSRGNAETHCSNIEIVQKNSTRKQKWVITALGNGKYSIWNYSSGMALGVAGVTPIVNRNISQYRRHYNNVKQFYIRKAKNGCVNIQVVGSDYVLAAERVSSAEGANIKLAKNSGREEALWLPVPTSTVNPVPGTYIMHSKLDDSRYISIEGASRYSMAQCILSGSCSAKQMTVYSAAQGAYLIHPVCSNYTLTACGEVKSRGAVKQFRVEDKVRQLWTFHDEGNGYYSIRSGVNSQLALDVSGGSTKEGTHIQLYKYNGRDSQLFSFEKTDGGRIVPNGYYGVKSLLNTGLSLDIKGNSKNSGANLQLDKYVGRNRQKFYLYYDKNGYYQIRNARSGLNLDVTGAKKADGANVTQYRRNTSDAQRWKPVGSDGVFYFKSALGNFALDVYAGLATAGTNVQIYTVNNTKAQKFKLDPVQVQTEKDYTVAIDAGHQRRQNTGKEPIGPGASSYKQKVSSGTEGRWSHLEEYELNLQVSLKLQSELENRGYNVYMVRTTHDVNISNAERAKLAANANADIFIRIHANGADSSLVRGALCYMPSSSNPYLTTYVKQGSQKLSRCILDAYCASTGLPNLGLLTGDDMTGINWASMPVTIVEMGFMSNRTDDLYMASAAGQTAIVQGIANGVDKYFTS